MWHKCILPSSLHKSSFVFRMQLQRNEKRLYKMKKDPTCSLSAISHITPSSSAWNLLRLCSCACSHKTSVRFMLSLCRAFLWLHHNSSVSFWVSALTSCGVQLLCRACLKEKFSAFLCVHLFAIVDSANAQRPDILAFFRSARRWFSSIWRNPFDAPGVIYQLHRCSLMLNALLWEGFEQVMQFPWWISGLSSTGHFP